MTGLLERSLQTAAAIIILILLRKFLLHKLPKFTFQAAWGVVILRLLLPFSVPVFPADLRGGISLATDFLTGDSQKADREKGDENAKEQEGASEEYGGVDLNGNENTVREKKENGAQPAGKEEFGSYAVWPGGKDSQRDDMYSNADTKAAPDFQKKEIVLRVLPVVWLFGVFSILLSFLLSHLRARRLYAAALPAEVLLSESDFYAVWGRRKKLRRRIVIKTSDRISAPVTYGIFSPVILLPKTTDWENLAQLRMVLAHEAVHIRRFDILYKYLLAAAAALHWFNPFVWAMYFLANRDIELSCDEAVVRRINRDAKKDYALALLNYEEKRMLSPTVSGFGGNAVRERIEAIMKINKTSIVSLAAAVVLVAGTTTVFAGAKESKNTPVNGREEILGGEPSSEGTNPEKEEHGGENSKTSVKQYLCEPAYYTLEEFEEFMEVERREIAAMLEDGSIEQKEADAAFAEIEKKMDEVRNGKKCEKPSQVFYADGTPVVNSQGGYLYVKASDIEQMNAQLRAKAEKEEETAIVEADNIAMAEEGSRLMTGIVLEDLPEAFASAETDLSWYTYAQYQEYAEKQKEEYRSMLGEWGFNSTDGWYEWDAEKIEEACRLLDDQLEFIKDGGMISVPNADGDCLVSGSSQLMFHFEEGKTWESGEAEAKEGTYPVDQAEGAASESGEFDGRLLKDYEAFGVTADEKTESYLYQGRKIAGVWDEGFLVLDGTAKEENGIYLKGVREDGKLAGVEEITEEEFRKITMRGEK